MRVPASCVVLLLCAACGQSTAPVGTTEPSAPDALNAARVSRTRTALPPGYEVTDLAAPSAPLTSWGLGPGWTADPPRCAELGDVGADGAPVHGWSASGPGGIVYAVVVDSPRELDPDLRAACPSWTVSAGHTRAQVTTTAAPKIEQAATAGMVAELTTTVENGTETHSRAVTFTAYLGGHVASATVVTDPGSPEAALPPDFASGLLTDVVAAVRPG